MLETLKAFILKGFRKKVCDKVCDNQGFLGYFSPIFSHF